MGSHPYASGCNAAYRREALDAIGGFGSHNLRREDVEASWLATGLGHSLGFSARSRILYVQRANTMSRAKQSFAWGAGMEALRRQFGSGPDLVQPLRTRVKRAAAASVSGRGDHLVAWASVAGQIVERSFPGRSFERIRVRAQPRTPLPEDGAVAPSQSNS